MYKLRFSGDPYEAGYKYGATSYKKNIIKAAFITSTEAIPL